MESGKGKVAQREDKLIGLSIYDLHAMGRTARRNGAFEEPSTERFRFWVNLMFQDTKIDHDLFLDE
jgi:hypothetical protein